MRKICILFIFMFVSFYTNAQSADSIKIAKSLILKGNEAIKNDTNLAIEYFNNAISLSKRLKIKDLAAEAYFETAEIYTIFDSLTKAKQCYEQSALLYEQTNNLESACQSYIELGNYLYEKSEFRQSHIAYNSAMSLLKDYKNYLLKAEVLIGSGKVFTKQGNITQALNDFVNALEIYEKINNEKGRADAWNQIGIIHWKEGKNAEALSAYKKALEIREGLKDSLAMSESYNNIGIINKLEKNYTTAYALYVQALGIRKKFNNEKGVSQTLFNIGSLKSEMGLISEALEYYNQSYKIKVKLKDEYGKLPCYLNIGDAYMLLKKYEEAEKNFINGLLLAEKLGAGDYHQSFHRELSKLFEKQNDFQKAYFHHVKYMALKDTLINVSNNSKLAELQTKYDISEKQRNIESLTLERKLDKEKYAQEIYFRNSLIVIIILILIIVFAVLNWGRLLKKSNVQLEEQKKIIEQREKEKEVLVREMHHRVKNNLQLTSSLLNLQARKMTDSEAVQSLKQARDRIHAISLIHQKLYSKDEISQINLLEYIPDLCNAVVQSNSQQNTKVLLDFKIEPIFISVDMAISIGLIINEAVINSLKHAFSKVSEGVIEISANKSENNINLSIKDNGSGIPKLDNLDNFGGFGFQLLRSFTTKLSGKMLVENNNGTIIKIQIPL
ncbi:MAG: tetratricopeptide repeat protein [Bacteroidia bacterium]|nr:tetratricopeptide repeat protein [Bacteroidia bacterium]